MSRLGHLIGVFGGSFDPPHLGHQMACLYLLESCGADEVWIVPVRDHPFGKVLAPYDHRAAMCGLMTQVFGDRCRVVDAEGQAGSSRTFDVLTYLAQRHAGLRFALAVGADILHEAPQWYRWQELCAAFPLIVIGRVGFQSDALALPEVSSSDVRALIGNARPYEHLVPRGVARYIEDNSLYRR